MKNAKIKSLSRLFILALILLGAVSVTSALIAIKNTSTIQASWETFELGRSEKARALGALRKEIGYGGMIHQFKNYVLRRDKPRIAKVQAKVQEIMAAIDAYRSLGLDEHEDEALETIAAVVAQYAAALALAESLDARGATPREIDKTVKISDGPALEAIAALNAEIIEAREGASAAVSGEVEWLSNLSIIYSAVVGVILTLLVAIVTWFTVLRLGRPLKAMIACVTSLAAGDTGTASTQVLSASQDVSRQSAELSAAVEKFLGNVRAT